MRARRLALRVWIIAAGISVAMLLVDVTLNRGARVGGIIGSVLWGPLLLAPTGIVGLLVVRREPRNPIGWMLVGAALLGAAYGVVGGYATLAIKSFPGVLPGGVYAVWLLRWIAQPLVLILGPILFLLFPTGRLYSPQWRPVLWLCVAFACASVVVGALSVGQLVDTFPGIRNPFGVLQPNPVLSALGSLSIAVTFALGLTSLVARYRRAHYEERQQIKLVLFTAAVAFMLGASLMLPDSPSFVWYAFVLSLVCMPIAIGIAILRYRLYDIDVLINRTLVYGVTTATLGAIYAIAVLVTLALLRPLTQGSELAVAASTLAVASLIQPVRRRVQDGVDRRFFRSRYDAARTLEAFGTRLRDEVDIDALRRELVAVVRDTMEPAHASVWLRDRAG